MGVEERDGKERDGSGEETVKDAQRTRDLWTLVPFRKMSQCEKKKIQ